MKKVLLSSSILMAIAAVFSSCSTQKSPFPGYTEKDGLYIKYIDDNDTGRAAMVGDIISLNMVYTNDKDSVILDSRQNGQPVQVKADTAQYIGDLMGAFIGMNVGDSASIIVSADSFFLKTARYPKLPDFVDSASMLYFSVRIKDVQSMEEIQSAQLKEQEDRMNNEKSDLEAYIQANYPDAQPTASGMYFISKKQGSGQQAEAGKTVKVHYKGMLLDGTYFDTSVKEAAQEQGLYDERREPYAPFEFPLGQGRVIQGWDEGIAMLKEGGEATLIIPSNLAYGANPRPGGPIKPYSTLIFEVELIEVVD